MAYSHKTQFPRSFVQIQNINNTAQTAFATQAGSSVAISHIVIASTVTAVKTVIFRAVADTPEYLRVTVPSASVGLSSIVIPGWRLDLDDGLELIDTANNTNGCFATIFYVTHGQT